MVAHDVAHPGVRHCPHEETEALVRLGLAPPHGIDVGSPSRPHQLAAADRTSQLGVIDTHRSRLDRAEGAVLAAGQCAKSSVHAKQAGRHTASATALRRRAVDAGHPPVSPGVDIGNTPSNCQTHEVCRVELAIPRCVAKEGRNPANRTRTAARRHLVSDPWGCVRGPWWSSLWCPWRWGRRCPAPRPTPGSAASPATGHAGPRRRSRSGRHRLGSARGHPGRPRPGAPRPDRHRHRSGSKTDAKTAPNTRTPPRRCRRRRRPPWAPSLPRPRRPATRGARSAPSARRRAGMPRRSTRRCCRTAGCTSSASPARRTRRPRRAGRAACRGSSPRRRSGVGSGIGRRHHRGRRAGRAHRHGLR